TRTTNAREERAMARIPGVPKGREGWLLRYAQRFSKKKVGAVTEPVGIMGHSTIARCCGGAAVSARS
ncbi:MAG: hypothetical protein VCC20_13905, partial [Myxococcota bacterium]